MKAMQFKRPFGMLLAAAMLMVVAGFDAGKGEAKAAWGPVYYGGTTYISYATYAAAPVGYDYVLPAGYDYGYYYPGPLRRLAARIRARRAARAYYYGYAPSAYTVAGYAPVLYGSDGCCGPAVCDPCGPICCQETFFDSQPVPAKEAPTPAAKPTPAQPTPAQPTPADATGGKDKTAKIEVALPANARVYVNNRLTTSTGERRSYISAGLRPGTLYAYRVRVEYERAGQPVVQQRVVHLRAGQQATLEFPPAEELLAAATLRRK